MDRKGFTSVIIAIVVVSIFLVGVAYWYLAGAHKSEIAPTNSTSTTTLTDSTKIYALDGFSPTGDGSTTLPCDQAACLHWENVFGNYFLTGYGQVVGYYTIASSSDDVGNPISEDELIITGGTEALVNAYTQLAQSGNTLNGITSDGKLIWMLGEHSLNMAADVDSSTAATLIQIYSSTPQKPVTLRINLAEPSFKD